MNTANNVYERLYNQMRNKLTVVNGDSEYTLGEYMLMKADIKKTASNLPVANTAQKSTAVSAFFKYVNDKLTVKEPPAKDKTIKKFPLRTVSAAFLSAIIASTLLFSYGQASVKNISDTSSVNVETVKNEDNFNSEYTYQTEK